MSDQENQLALATIAVHGKKRMEGHHAGETVRSLSTPIYQSSTFAFESAEQGARLFAGEEEGYIYTRIGNPTVAALEKEIAYLEGGDAAAAFSSGMAASHGLVLTLASTGDNIVASDTLYGGTHSLFQTVLPRMGIEAREVDATDLGNIERAIDERTKLIFVETPANPTMRLVDIEKCASIARKHKIPFAVDNTFATPYLQSPMALGADIVVHSATKYICGHGDTVAGLVVGGKELIAHMKDEIVKDVGGCISPFNAWLLLRGLKTLAVRMERHSANAMKVAQYLSFHPMVDSVSYPGLRTHPEHELAKRQMRDFGGMIAFEVKGGREAGRILMNSVRLCVLAVSLGDCETLIQHPATMTHSTYSPEDLAKVKITEGLVRLSVGIEDPDDIVRDLRQALRRIELSGAAA